MFVVPLGTPVTSLTADATSSAERAAAVECVESARRGFIMERIRTRGLAAVPEMDEENTGNTTGRQAQVSGDKANDRRTYGAAIEVPEMVLVEFVESIQAEVTSIPRNQTRKISRRAAV